MKNTMTEPKKSILEQVKERNAKRTPDDWANAAKVNDQLAEATDRIEPGAPWLCKWCGVTHVDDEGKECMAALKRAVAAVDEGVAKVRAKKARNQTKRGA